MKRWVAAIALLGSLLAAPPARAAQDAAFRKVAPESWAYTAVRRLEANGLYTGSPAGTFAGTRPLTRYDFAVAVERLYRGLQPQVLAATEPGTLPASVRDLKRLLEEFGPDLTAVGQDPAEMRRQVDQLEQRLIGLGGPAAALPVPGRANDSTPSSIWRSRLSGLARALDRSGGYDPLGLADSSPHLRSLLPGGFRPGVAAGVGPALAGLQFRDPDSMAAGGHIPFVPASALVDYRAQLTAMFGPVSVSAFYDRQGLLADRNVFDLGRGMGPAQGLGGAVSAPIFDRLQLRLEAASLRAMEDDFSRMAYLQGMLRYNLTPGLSFTVGARFSRTLFPGTLGMDDLTYVVGMGQSFGRNARLDFLLRYSGGPRGLGDTLTPADASSSAAITQLSVKF